MDMAPGAAAASPSMANIVSSSSVGRAAAAPSANIASTVSTPSSSQESLSPPPSPLHEEETQTTCSDDFSQLDLLIDEIYTELATYRPELSSLIMDEETVEAIFDNLNAFRPHFALVLASLPPEAFPIDPVLVARSGFEALVSEVWRQWRS